MTGKHEADADPVMRVDDPVGLFGGTRQRALLIGAAGVLVMGIAAVLLFAGLSRGVDRANDSAALSQSDIRDLKELLAERRTQRDAEADKVQKQLDAQSRLICLVIVDFRDRARTPEVRAILGKATRTLDCKRLLAPEPASTSATSSPAPSASASAPTSPSASQRPSLGRSPTNAPTSTQPTAGPTSSPHGPPPSPLVFDQLCRLAPLLCLTRD